MGNLRITVSIWASGQGKRWTELQRSPGVPRSVPSSFLAAAPAHTLPGDWSELMEMGQGLAGEAEQGWPSM